MKQLVIIAIIYFTSVTHANAQMISGNIKNAENSPVPKATISLLHVEDSSLVKLDVSENDGSYRFQSIIPGEYLVLATVAEYLPLYSDTIKVDQDPVAVPVLIVEKATTQLQGVVVTAKKSPIEVKAGKTVVNVDASPSNAGLNVLEVLEKSPGIAVDNDGNISLKGKGGVMILIDDKPTYLSGSQLAALLKSIQAGSLSQIEIMTNPPAKYDAAGNAGVINIKTKKGAIKGLNGSVDANYAQGFYPKFNGGANLNYRNNRLNIFGSYNGGQWEGTGILYINRKFYEEGRLTGLSDQQTQRHNKSNWHNAKFGADYNFSDKDMAGFVVTGNINPWKNWQNSTSNLRDADQSINTRLHSDVYNANKSSNLNINLNYKHSFDSLGREITVDLDRGFYNSDGNNELTTRVYNPDNTQRGNTVTIRGEYPSVINIYSGKIDYIHPFNKNLKLETGIKSSVVNTDNRGNYLRNTGDGWVPDIARSNHFIYDENINAAYAVFSAVMKKWEFSTGLRVENTNAKGTQVTTDSNFTRKYTNLFPNLGVGYNMSDKNQLNLSYSRRLRRPDYDDLNPFIFFLDSLTYGQGNPYLQPQFSNNIEISHTYNKFLTTTLNYTQTDDIITQIIKMDNDLKTAFQTKENFSKMKQWGITVTANKQINKWWNINIYANGFSNQFDGLYNDGSGDVPVEVDITGFMGNMTNSIVFAKSWTTEISGWYTSRLTEGLLVGGQMWSMNAALSKKVLNNKGTVKLGVRDIFRTNNFRAASRYADVDIDVFNNRKSDNPQVSLSFSYKFGKNGSGPAKRRVGSSADEQQRVGGGNN